jgi:hypothetical protein
MENSIGLWNKIAELLESIGLPHVSESGAIMIFAAAFLVLLFILWLVFRNMRLWYWKTNIQIDTLKSIDGRLQSMEEKLSVKVVQPVAVTAVSPIEDEAAEPLECGTEVAVREPEGLVVVGRSGRIYTEAELELQIRD